MAVYSKETALYDAGRIGDGIEDAGGTATNFITNVGIDGIFVHQTDAGMSGTEPTDANAYGVHITDSVNIVRGGDVMAVFGGGDGDEITLGNEDSSEYMMRINSSGSTFSRVTSDGEDSMYSYRAQELSGVVTYEEVVGFSYNAGWQYNFAMSRWRMSALSSIVYAAIIVDGQEIVLVENGVKVETGYNTNYYDVYQGNFYITRVTFEEITGHGIQAGEKIRIRYRTNGTINCAQMWLGNCEPEDDIRLQVAKDDNTPGVTVDGNGSITAANIDSGVTEDYTTVSESSGSGNIAVNFNKTFPTVPNVVGTLMDVQTTAGAWSGTHQLVLQLVSVTTTGAIFQIRNNGSADRKTKISWLAIG